jgi:hypothetical protein
MIRAPEAPPLHPSASGGFRKFSMEMSPREVKLLKSWLAKAHRYLEFGAGRSTERALAHPGICRIDSVESSAVFAREVLPANPVIQAGIAEGRLRIHHIDIGETGSMGYPVNKSRRESWPAYPESVHALDGPWDTVLVDGRFRLACIANVLLSESRDAVILVHDFWNRNQYHPILNHLDVLESGDRMGVFRARPRPDLSALRKLADEHRYVAQ